MENNEKLENDKFKKHWERIKDYQNLSMKISKDLSKI